MIKTSFLQTFFVFLSCFIILYYLLPVSKVPEVSGDNIPTIFIPISLINETNLSFDEFPLGQTRKSAKKINSGLNYFSLNSKGRVISNFPVLPGIILTPFYYLYSLINKNILSIRYLYDPRLLGFIFFMSSFITALTAAIVFIYLQNRHKKIWLSLLGCFVFVFASPVIHTSSRFVWQHTFSLLFLTLTLYFYSLKKFVPLLLFSILAFLTRPLTLLLTVPLIVNNFPIYLHKLKDKGINLSEIILLLISLSLLIFQFYYSLTYLDGKNLFALQYSSDRFNGNIFEGFLGLLFSPGRGLFFFSPIFFFSFMQLLKNRQKNAVYLIGILLYIFVTAKWDMWYGGWSYGYRLLTELVPILTFALMEYVSKTRSALNLRYIALYLFIFISIIVNTSFLTILDDCGYNKLPKDIDMLSQQEFNNRIWFDSAIFRCMRNF